MSRELPEIKSPFRCSEMISLNGELIRSEFFTEPRKDAGVMRDLASLFHDDPRTISKVESTAECFTLRSFTRRQMPRARSTPQQTPRRDTELRAAVRVRHVGALPAPVDVRRAIDCRPDPRRDIRPPQTANGFMELQGQEQRHGHVHDSRGVEQRSGPDTGGSRDARSQRRMRRTGPNEARGKA